MPELRLVRFGIDYWHLVNDEHGAHEGIIGSLLRSDVAGNVLPWRAEFAPIWGNLEDMAVGYFTTQQEALDFMTEKLREKEEK